MFKNITNGANSCNLFAVSKGFRRPEENNVNESASVILCASEERGLRDFLRKLENKLWSAGSRAYNPLENNYNVIKYLRNSWMAIKLTRK